jgi:hypothetical protein
MRSLFAVSAKKKRMSPGSRLTAIGERSIFTAPALGFDRRIEYARVYIDIVILAGSEKVVDSGGQPAASRPLLWRFCFPE